MVHVEIKIKAFDDIASFAFKVGEESEYDVLEYFAELVLRLPEVLGNRVTWQRLDQAVQTFNQILDISREIKVMNASDPDLDVAIKPSLPAQGRARRSKTDAPYREQNVHEQHGSQFAGHNETPCVGPRSQTTPLPPRSSGIDDMQTVKGPRASSPNSQGSNISGSTSSGFRRLSNLIYSQTPEFPSLPRLPGPFRAFSNLDGDQASSQDSILPNEAAQQEALRMKDEQKHSPVSQLPLPPDAPRAHSASSLRRRPHWLSALGVK